MHPVFRSSATSLVSVKKHEIMVLAYQVGPFHLTLTQINSEMNCIAKNKCSESQKLDTRCRGDNLNATLHLSRVTTYIHIFFHSLSLIYSDVRQEKHQKILLSFCEMFVLGQ